jgi:hypothetical protein
MVGEGDAPRCGQYFLRVQKEGTTSGSLHPKENVRAPSVNLPAGGIKLPAPEGCHNSDSALEPSFAHPKP